MDANIKAVFDDMRFDDPEHRKMLIESYNELWQSHENLMDDLTKCYRIIQNLQIEVNRADLNRKTTNALHKALGIKKII